MSKEQGYTKQIKELVKAYGEALVAELLSVSTRTIRNYTNEEKPTYPHDGTARKLQEIYTRHAKGLPILAESKPETADPSREIVGILKDTVELLKAQLREKDIQITELKDRNAALTHHVNQSFIEVKKQAIVNRAYLKTGLHRLDDVLILLDRKTPPEKIRSHTDSLLAASQEGGS